MQTDLNHIANLALFAKVIQAGGIARCAGNLGIERSTVSRRLAALETNLGVKLLERTQRRFELTDAGKRCFEQCERLLDLAQHANSVAADGNAVVECQPIVIGAPPDVFEFLLDDKLSAFVAENPEIEFERYPVSTRLDDIAETVDLMVTWIHARSNIGATQRLASVRQSVYASSSYLAKFGEPGTPYDLDAHICVGEGVAWRSHVWEFQSNMESIRKGLIRRFEVSGLLEARETALAGMGLAMLPDCLCRAYVESGHLARVVTDFGAKSRDLYLTTPKRANAKPRVTALRLHLEDAFRKASAT